MESTPLQVRTVTEAAYRQIRDLILTGHFAPGQWVRERELTELLGVSRTPIREALRLLEQEQMVVAESRKGFRIPVPTESEIRAFYELRAELEGFAAAKAAHRATPEQVGEIRWVLAEADEALAREEWPQVIQWNNQFHQAVAQASGNAVLAQTLAKLQTQVNLFRVLSWTGHRERPSTTHRQHREIFNAIEARQEGTARARAEDHIWDSLPLALSGLSSVHHQ
ncbi:MAG: GntR family transcriptional regulator [Firmicutes bacterium]|nr:GntR family transcriptional regulator [Bacillota bacterium]